MTRLQYLVVLNGDLVFPGSDYEVYGQTFEFVFDLRMGDVVRVITRDFECHEVEVSATCRQVTFKELT